MMTPEGFAEREEWERRCIAWEAAEAAHLEAVEAWKRRQPSSSSAGGGGGAAGGGGGAAGGGGGSGGGGSGGGEAAADEDGGEVGPGAVGGGHINTNGWAAQVRRLQARWRVEELERTAIRSSLGRLRAGCVRYYLHEVTDPKP